MKSIEMDLENDIEEVERRAKKKEQETQAEQEEFERNTQKLLIRLSQQEAVRLLVLEEFRKRILKAQEEYRRNQEREEERFSMKEIDKYLKEQEELPSKTEEQTREEERDY